MIARPSILILALFSGGLFAQSTESPLTLDEILVQNESMSRIGDGLYFRKTESGEAFVATNDAGQQALLARLQDIRARLTATGNARSEQGTLKVVDQLSDSIHHVGLSNQQSGDCNGPGGSSPYLYAIANSSLGTSASATAQNTNASYYTTNVVSASTQNGLGDETSYQASTTYGTTPATVSVNAPSGSGGRAPCTASAAASVTCPGATHPSVSAFAFSQRPVPNGSCIL